MLYRSYRTVLCWQAVTGLAGVLATIITKDDQLVKQLDSIQFNLNEFIIVISLYGILHTVQSTGSKSNVISFRLI